MAISFLSALGGARVQLSAAAGAPSIANRRSGADQYPRRSVPIAGLMRLMKKYRIASITWSGPSFTGLSASAADGCGDLAEALLQDFGDRLFPFAHVGSPLWQCYGLWGFEGMMILIAERPELVRHACERLLRKAARIAAYLRPWEEPTGSCDAPYGWNTRIEKWSKHEGGGV